MKSSSVTVPVIPRWICVLFLQFVCCSTTWFTFVTGKTASSSLSSDASLTDKDNGLPPIVKYHRYIVLGAGPAGLQMAHYLQSAGRDYVVIDEVRFVFFGYFGLFRSKILSLPNLLSIHPS